MVSDGFPKDFSVFATFKTTKKTKQCLFSMYSGGAKPERVLGLDISQKPRLFYSDQKKQPGTKSPAFKTKELVDGK